SERLRERLHAPVEPRFDERLQVLACQDLGRIAGTVCACVCPRLWLTGAQHDRGREQWCERLPGHCPAARTVDVLAKCRSYHAMLRRRKSTRCAVSRMPWPERGERTCSLSPPASRSAMKNCSASGVGTLLSSCPCTSMTGVRTRATCRIGERSQSRSMMSAWCRRPPYSTAR